VSAPHGFDVIVIGSGPAGQKAAVQAAKVGQRVLVVEREIGVGGACVHRGTIPSKSLRETAAYFQGLKARSSGVFDLAIPPHLQVASLMTRMDSVVRAHERFMGNQLERNGIVQWHGRARFVSPAEVEVVGVRGERRRASGRWIVVATGSRPRAPKGIPIDHEQILDSDSILSLTYLPASLTVLGAGVIASEYASIFAALGVRVTMIDKGERPLGFLDPELSDAFRAAFEGMSGSRYLGARKVGKVAFDGVASVRAELDGGGVVASEKLLVGLGRVANVEDLALDAAGLAVDERGVIPVDEHCRTRVAGIYAVGDVIGPPSLASSSMEQGRRAMRHALGLALGTSPENIPSGIYTIPEMSSIGLDEHQARKKHGGAIVGRARYSELARGHLAAQTEGIVKIVCDPDGKKVLGAQILGEGATELIHLAQMAIAAGSDADVFVENIFNFPTLAEAYRVAALDVQRQRAAPRAPVGAGA
jgi:NAD(P) transhydrogenase